MNEIKNKKIIELLELLKPLTAVEQLLKISDWDQSVSMPKAGFKMRSEIESKISSLLKTMYLDDRIVEVAEDANNEKDLSDSEKGLIRLLKRTLYYYYKLPKEFLENYSKVVTIANERWIKAREKNDFKIFYPELEKIIDLNLQKAEYLEFDNHPYDALLDLYEEGLTTSDVESFFELVKTEILDIMNLLKQKKDSRSNDKLKFEEYRKENVEKLNYKILEFLGYDADRIRMDVSAHPFTQGVNQDDVRITTKYSEKNFKASICATIHEFGHALYEMNVNREYGLSILSSPQSLVIHESQSRFFENIIGRNEFFLKEFTPKFKKLGENFRKYTPKDYYNYFNHVKPSLIRVDADELTYHLHIYIRFKLEKLLLEKTLSPKDLEKEWNNQYYKLLGVKPKNSKEGILQDIHWSKGYFGYFPTYSLGTVLSSYWAERIEIEIGSIDKLINEPDGISKIKNWLKINVHTYGPSYTLKDLLNKKFKTEFDIEPWKRYVRKKFLQS